MNNKLSGLKAVSMALATSMLTTGALAAPSAQNVIVTNPASSPVPVTGTGANGAVTVSGSVGITGTPAVTVSGTPSVNIANTPSVTLSGTPSVTLSGTPTVNVSNSPLPSELVNTGGAGTGVACVGVTIPAGKVLIVKRVSVSAQDASYAGSPGFIGLSTPNAGSVGLHFVTFDANGNASYDFEFPAGLIVFGGSGQQVCSQVEAASNHDVGNFLYVNGYLANNQ